MASATSFREETLAVVEPGHCKGHPWTEAWDRRWFYFDGVHVKQVLGYNLGNQPA